MCAFDWHHDDRWQWMTLKVRIFEEFRGITQILEATAAKRIKIDPYCQRQRCNPLHVFLTDRTNGRAIGTVLRPSVVVVCRLFVFWLNGAS